ncbi:transglycosylase domain-containing protein [Actinomadura sp. 6K520]|uniref:transglycosylase domain-containing protein n=1 Tax=Actinomadura sp. 6K520 TaxID=2530364 RepID=UPI001045A570|nr:transglycosylase domain-containing protein [Actinomadura sp. 6K520]TDE32032.1 penicillin-binding protein [Actinomadura sp. 6K520]
MEDISDKGEKNSADAVPEGDEAQSPGTGNPPDDPGERSANGDANESATEMPEAPTTESATGPTAESAAGTREESAAGEGDPAGGDGRDAAGGTGVAAAASVEAATNGDTSSMPPSSPHPSAPRHGGPPGDAAGRDGGGGKGPGRPRSRRSRLLRRTLFVMLGFLGFCVAAFAVAYLFTPVPSPLEKAVAQGPTFYYSDGKTQIAKTGVNRDAVDLDRIPESTRNAVIAAENGTFYEDPGVSVRGTARAFWSTVTGRQLQGGSTITQQMVRNYYGGIGKERSVTRKLKEVMVALKVDQEKEKDWILEQYLNTIYFGRNAYGVQAAARAYYDKDVSKLTAAEGAYIAAAIQQPSYFADPTGSARPLAEQRWRAVLNNMVRDGYLGSAEAASMKFPEPVKQEITDVLKGQKGYMVNVAKKELVERRGYSEDEINRSGLKITTTFDKRLMDAMKRSVSQNTPDGMSKKIRTGAVSVDPSTGQVLAFYGGRGYLEEALSSSFGDWAQAGSGFKPIALAAALENGETLGSTYDGSSPQHFGGSAIKNDGGRSFGMVNLVTATQNSVNTAYVNLGQDIGNDKIVKMAEKMGIPKSQMKPEQRGAATFPLGIVSLHPVQQAGVFATFAAEGVHREPFVVKSVTDNADHKRTFKEKGERALSQQNARDATYAMEQVVRGGTGTAAQLFDGRDVAGKTGTTDEGRAIWFNGFIPQMATSVAMFRSDGKPLDIPGYGAYGGALPAQIWRTYMTDAVNIKDYEPESFGAPSSRPGGNVSGPPDDDRPNGSEPPRTTEPEEPPTDRPDEPELPQPPTGVPTLPPTEPGDPGGGGDEPGDPGGGGGGDDDGGGGSGGGGGRPGANG